jgi:hypothetical protein
MEYEQAERRCRIAGKCCFDVLRLLMWCVCELSQLVAPEDDAWVAPSTTDAGIELQFTGGEECTSTIDYALTNSQLDHTSVASERFQRAGNESNRQQSLHNTFQCIQDDPKVGATRAGDRHFKFRSLVYGPKPMREGVCETHRKAEQQTYRGLDVI